MDNMYRPTGGDPQDSRSTEQFWAMNPGPSGRPRPGPFPPEAPGMRQHYARDRRRALHWTIGLTAAVVLAAAGVIAGISLGGGSAPAASTSAAGNTSAAGTGPAPGSQAAALNSALNSADAPGTLSLTSATSAAGTMNNGAARAAVAHPCLRAARAARAARIAGRPRAARAAAGHCRWLRHRIFRAVLLRGIDGQFTFRTAHGIRTLAFERGTVQSVSSSAIVVQASDGTTWTWDLAAKHRGPGERRQDAAQRAGHRAARLGRRASGLGRQGRPAHRDPAAQPGLAD